MVKLNDIELNDNIIGCDLYPEDSTEPGHIKVDVQTEEIIESSLPIGYENCRSHLSHARWNLIKMAHSGEIPKKKTIMWY